MLIQRNQIGAQIGSYMYQKEQSLDFSNYFRIQNCVNVVQFVSNVATLCNWDDKLYRQSDQQSGVSDGPKVGQTLDL